MKQTLTAVALVLFIALIALTVVGIWTVDHDEQNRIFATAGIVLGCTLLGAICALAAWFNDETTPYDDDDD